MNYFRPYSLPLDETIVAAWDSQVVEAAETPWLAQALATQSADLFPRFAAYYAQLRALPRGARRALQRNLARSREVAMPSAWQRKLAHSLAGAALLLALAQGAQAATIKVHGKCSLITAIVNANDDAATFPECAAGSGADTIVLPAGSTHVLTYAYDYSYGPTGLPVISSPITIVGNSAKITRKPGSHDKPVPDFRLIAVSSSGDLTLRNVTLRGGVSPFAGGGVFNGGTLIIKNSTISGNTAYSGGGIANYYGTLTIENSTISGNTAEYEAGGVYNGGTLIIKNSTISGNTAAYGGGIFDHNSMTITNSTISQNTATDKGGGIFSDGTLPIENSTISGNTAGVGGGIFHHFDTLTIQNSTISGNTADSGGGVFNSYTSYPHSYLTLNRSLILGNNAAVGPEVANDDIVFADDFNLFGSNGSSGVTGFAPGPSDVVPGVALSKILGPLKNNGGPTKTHALKAGSPAIDAIPSADPACTGTDQRGVTRPRGAACDIGAFEK